MPHDRFKSRQEHDGTWSVVDVFTDFPAALQDRSMQHLTVEASREMSDFLNALDRKRRARQISLGWHEGVPR